MKTDTKIVASGRDPRKQYGLVNPPVTRGSTVVFPTLAEFHAASANRNNRNTVIYGRWGTPVTFALEEAIAELEGGADKCRAIAVSSGMAANTAAILAFVKAGDHLLVPDNVYGPVRKLSDDLLTRFGVETTFYDPMIGAGIETLMRRNTAMIYLEAPGSLTFEMPDITAIVAVARGRGVATAIDNTWATPVLFRPLEHGIDVSIMAATKYIVGHSDAMLGILTVPEEHFLKIKTATNAVGCCPGPDDCYLGLRGLRTLGVRLRQHEINALKVAEWFKTRPEVRKVLYPALPDDPGYPIWNRLFDGASGLFAVVFGDYPMRAIEAMVDGYEHFGIGASWGGYESLILPVRLEGMRTATSWRPEGPAMRYHIGLEDPDDLIADLEAGFERLHKAAKGRKTG